MLTLKISKEPYWLDIGYGVKVKVKPCTSAVFYEAKAYMNAKLADLAKEYKANKDRLISNRLQLENELENILQMQKEKELNKEDVLQEIKSVNDILKNPDVGYEEKGNLIRTILDQIVYDKESGKMYFDIIVS